MFCPKCAHANPPDTDVCVKCEQDLSYVLRRVSIGHQFIFMQADEEHPVALKVGDEMRTYRSATILSRHQHAVSFGEALAESEDIVRSTWPFTDQEELKRALLLLDKSKLPYPSLELLTVVTDRKIYQPNTDATLFIVAPDAAGSEASLEIRLAGHKVYEAKVPLNQDGLALHPYTDLREGEYTAVVTLPNLGNAQAECTFSVAEYTLSPLIAVLEEHKYAERRLSFTLKLLQLSVPYSGSVEFGLQCQVCGGRVVATQKVKAQDGLAKGDFDVSGHGGPFHVQVTTPDGNTALVAFPGTGAVERERVKINPLGQTAEMGLLPWVGAQPMRGFYVGLGEVNTTPLMLESVHATKGRLQVASDVTMVQIITFDPRARTSQPRAKTSQVIERTGLKRGEVIEFEVNTPCTLFTVGAFTQDGRQHVTAFEGWGTVIRPVEFGATLTAPTTALPGEVIDVAIELSPSHPGESPTSAFCWLLAYDARLEHESPLPKLAKRIYNSVRDATSNLDAGPVLEAALLQPQFRAEWGRLAGDREMSLGRFTRAEPGLFEKFYQVAQAPAPADITVEAPVMVATPARMEFPELAHNELFYLEGQASRTVKLGDQIGTWRVRAYVFKGTDYRELTSDVQAEKPVYAELDLPAIASPGDDIMAAVNYNTREPADLVIATPFGETRTQVTGSGTERFPIKGPGRVEVRIEGQAGADWTVRDVAPPGVQKVTASCLMILDKGQTMRGEQVVVYVSMGQVLKDTITALIGYPFG